MGPAENFVPKMTPPGGTGYEGEGRVFRAAGEVWKQPFAGRALLVSDGNALSALLPPAFRAFTVVLEGDEVLPLFSAPDDVSRVVAVGGPAAMRAARCFAEIRRTPCFLVPADGTFDGVFERTAQLRLGGELRRVPLAEGELFCDGELLRSSLPAAFARLCLARLALFEARALAALNGRAYAPHQAALPLTEGIADLNAEQIYSRNLALRKAEREGLPVGEGVVLARSASAEAGKIGEWGAFCLLSALYAAFFRYGKPRRYFIPDYARRAAAAGVEYRDIRIPTVAEYVSRAVALERARGELAREAERIYAEKGALRRAFTQFGGEERPLSAARLVRLPELCADGLCALLRDFGSLEL